MAVIFSCFGGGSVDAKCSFLLFVAGFGWDGSKHGLSLPPPSGGHVPSFAQRCISPDHEHCTLFFFLCCWHPWLSGCAAVAHDGTSVSPVCGRDAEECNACAWAGALPWLQRSKLLLPITLLGSYYVSYPKLFLFKQHHNKVCCGNTSVPVSCLCLWKGWGAWLSIRRESSEGLRGSRLSCSSSGPPPRCWKAGHLLGTVFY